MDGSIFSIVFRIVAQQSKQRQAIAMPRKPRYQGWITRSAAIIDFCGAQRKNPPLATISRIAFHYADLREAFSMSAEPTAFEQSDA
jgi:hypothetical protein